MIKKLSAQEIQNIIRERTKKSHDKTKLKTIEQSLDYAKKPKKKHEVST